MQHLRNEQGKKYNINKDMMSNPKQSPDILEKQYDMVSHYRFIKAR